MKACLVLSQKIKLQHHYVMFLKCGLQLTKLQLAVRTSVFNQAIAIKDRMNENNAFPWLLE